MGYILFKRNDVEVRVNSDNYLCANDVMLAFQNNYFKSWRATVAVQTLLRGLESLFKARSCEFIREDGVGNIWLHPIVGFAFLSYVTDQDDKVRDDIECELDSDEYGGVESVYLTVDLTLDL